MADQSEYQYDVFISYADADRAWAEGYLMDALENADISIHSEEAFALGVPRLVEFERAIRSSRRSLLVLSPAYLSDQFGQFTDLLAQTYGLETATWPVIPLILHPVELPPRLAMLQSLDAADSDRWDEAVARLCAELNKPAPAPPPIPPCPYPGMVPFGEADSRRFFGRDREIRDLLERLRQHPFLAVIGASGSGKSSLVFAGLLPALRKSTLFDSGGARSGWQVRSMRPGEAPLAAIDAALGCSAAEPAQAVANLLVAHPSDKHLLLIVDQFEELFTLGAESADDFQRSLLALSQVENCYVVLTVRADFYSDLMTSFLWSEIQSHRVEVLPMDEDGLRQCMMRPAEDAGVYVESTLIERLIADAAGEPGVLPLVQETLVLLWQYVKRRFLPLLSYENLVLSRQDYGDSERTGLQVAIAHRADATLADLLPEQQAVTRRIFIRLVQFGEGRADTRRQQPLSKLRAVSQNPLVFRHALDHLVDNRLLTVSGAEGDKDKKVDIAHEALIRGWPTLQKWISERRNAEQTRRLLESKAAEWIRLEKKGGILEEIELLEAEQWLDSADAADLGYDQTLRDLAEASRAALKAAEREREEIRQRELEAAHRLAEEAAARERIQVEAARRLRKRAWVLAGIGTVAIILAAISLFFYWQAMQARDLAYSRELSAEALSYVDSDAPLSLQLALTGVEIKRTIQGENALRQALLSAYPFKELLGHEDAARAVAWSHGGKYLASASYDGTIRIWDRATGTLQTTLVGHKEGVRGIAWNPDDTRLASASFDNTVRIWDVLDVKPRWLGHLAVLQTFEANANTVDWSPDGQRLLTSSANGLVHVLDAQSGAILAVVSEGENTEVNKAVWSPDGTRFAYASDNFIIKVWTLKDLLAPLASTSVTSTVVLTGHENYVVDVDWSPDGQSLASASYDGTVRTWKASGGTSIDRLVGHEVGGVRSIDWSPDGKYLLSAADDRSIRIWNVSMGTSTAKLTGHRDWVYDARWHPDGMTIASASKDKSVRIWDLAIPGVYELTGHQGEVRAMAWSYNGQWLASGADDGMVRLWNVAGGFSPERTFALGAPVAGLDWNVQGDQLTALSTQGLVGIEQSGTLITFTAHMARSYALAWHPDGTRLATVSRDGGVRLWDRQLLLNMPAAGGQNEGGTPQPLAAIPNPPDDRFISIAWSPDGNQVATGSAAGKVQVRDTQTLESTAVFTGHADIVWALAWRPDGEELASVSQDGKVMIWYVDQPEAGPLILSEHASAVNDIQTSPDGTMFATASDDKTIRLWRWNNDDGVSVSTLHGPVRGIWSIAWSPDGQRIAAAAMDGTVWVFYTRFDDILEVALKQNISSMTSRELDAYFGIGP